MQYTEAFKNVPLKKVKKEFTHTDFIRDALIKISAKENSPVDVLSSRFSDVEESEVDYVVANANVSINYTCMVGTDRTEEYWDRESQKNRTRTVTDWSPLSGQNNSYETIIVENKEDNRTGVYISSSTLGAFKEESFESSGTTDIEPDALPRMKRYGETRCFERVHLPGDHHKNERYSGNVDVTVAEVWKLPFYSAKYTYNGIEYSAAACASGKLGTDCSYPNESENDEKLAKKKARPFLIAAPVAFVLGLVLCFINILAVVGSILVFASIGLLVTYFIMKKEYYKKITGQKLVEKKNRLIKKLAEEGMPELSSEELALFE